MRSLQTKTQVSAGGVAFRRRRSRTEVALISVGERERWQLPKGTVDKGEQTESAALREVREEAGIETELIELIDRVEYWYFASERGERVRFHKFVYFYLLRYLSGDVREHDHEVNEARWFEINRAEEILSFKNEQEMVARAHAMISALG
ncbi:MAG TPA: NUDIX domain-containing protein [Pyrinomonadaceae bacterium]|nr:NUDIX domain-containing protein [Pyrinomonadaceae bacterium]